MELRPFLSFDRSPRRGVIAMLMAGSLLAVGGSVPALEQGATPPPFLHETGLYSDEGLEIDAAHIAFSPQYPLWTDGASKRRWISLPAGAAIDASDPDSWVFPVGTKLWKEFAFDGRRIETRFMERLASGKWLYATYVWDEVGTKAILAPIDGVARAFEDGRRSYTIPSVSDCTACHGSRPEAVLGFTALQLSDARDRNALHAEAPSSEATSLTDLVANGSVTGLRDNFDTAQRIAASSETERAAIGYIVGNCGFCHNARGPLASIGLYLDHDGISAAAPAIQTALGQPATRPFAALPKGALRIAPGEPENSVLFQRLAGTNPYTRMPPLGTSIVDEEAVDIIERWITETSSPRAETSRSNPGD